MSPKEEWLLSISVVNHRELDHTPYTSNPDQSYEVSLQRHHNTVISYPVHSESMYCRHKNDESPDHGFESLEAFSSLSILTTLALVNDGSSHTERIDHLEDSLSIGLRVDSEVYALQFEWLMKCQK